MQKINLFLSVAIVALLLVAPSQAAEHTKDSLDKVKKNLKEKKAILLDVRELSEWNDGHLKAAKLMPLSKLRDGEDPKKIVKEVDKKKILYCHCRSGRRVLAAADILKKLGYDIRPLKDGYSSLLGAGFEKADD